MIRRWKKSRKKQSSPLVAYLDWADSAQRDLEWRTGYLDNRTIIPKDGGVSVGDQMEAIRNTYPHIDALAYVRSGNVMTISHPRVGVLSSAALLDKSRLARMAEKQQMTRPTVVIAPASVITLAEEDDARRLAAELSIAYAILPLSECSFEWGSGSK